MGGGTPGRVSLDTEKTKAFCLAALSWSMSSSVTWDVPCWDVQQLLGLHSCLTLVRTAAPLAAVHCGHLEMADVVVCRLTSVASCRKS